MSASISIDAMGGDRAPGAVVEGAVRAAREMPDVSLSLVGIEEVVRGELERCDWAGENIRVVPAREVIGMGDSPVESVRKKRGSSIEQGVRLLREGECHAFLSAGNTGACVAAAQLFLRLLPGVHRAGILVTFQVGSRPVCLMDVGANVAARAEHLNQYGVMASVYARDILGVEEPRVGLLNIGAEDEKGNELLRASRDYFQRAGLNYVGYVEGDDFYRDTSDVVVCDGFTGNVVLKVSEGLAEQLTRLFRGMLEGAVKEVVPDRQQAASREDPREMLEQVIHRSLNGLQRRLDYSEYGGAPLLGVDGVVVIAHGRSDATAIRNAIGVAKRMVEQEFNGRIACRIAGD